MTDPHPEGPFQSAATALYDSGLGWPLPIPLKRKTSPPRGYTGHDGAEPEPAIIEAWAQREAQNVALRLAPEVVGIDIDAYKDGVSELWATLESKHGQLPFTAMVTNRDDGMSGIYLYRIDPESSAESHGVVGPGIEVIRYGHRYVVAPPSLHPEGRTYRWEVNGEVTDTPPSLTDLPELPPSWVTHLELGPDCWCGASEPSTQAAPAAGSGSWADEYIAPSQTHKGRDPQGHYQEALAAISTGASRHDATLRAVQALVRFRDEGDEDAQGLIDDLRARFTKAVTDDGTRQVKEAKAEFDRMERGAVRNVDRNPAVTSTVGPSLPTQQDATRFQAVSFGDLAVRADEPLEWDIEGVLRRGGSGAIAGMEKSLKSQLALHLSVSMSTGAPFFGHYPVDRTGNVLVYSGEGGTGLFARRLLRIAKGLGADPRPLSKRVGVVSAVGRVMSQRFVEGLQTNIDRWEPALIIIDPAYAYLGGDVEAGNVLEMGERLAVSEQVVREAAPDATLLWVHHAHKQAEGKEMKLSSMSQAGWREWVNDWFLMWHREDPNPTTGEYRLRVKVGSRHWGERVLDLDYSDGVLDMTNGRFSRTPTWNVTDVGHGALGKGGPKRPPHAVQAEAIKTLVDEGKEWEATPRQLRDLMSGSKDENRKAIDSLLGSGILRVERLRPVGGRMARRIGIDRAEMRTAVADMHCPDEIRDALRHVDGALTDPDDIDPDWSPE